MERPQAITHALVDGVRYSNAFKRLYSRDDVDDIEPLYLMTRWSSLAEQGPILVRLKSNSLAEEANKDDRLYRSLSLLSSQASTSELGKHLGRFITFTGEEGEHEQLLRFADPLVTKHWLSSYGSELPAEIMGPIDAWWVADWVPNWAMPRSLTWQKFRSSLSSEPVMQENAFPPMGSSQLAALDGVDRWQLKERLTDYFKEHAAEAWRNLPAEDRGQWLDERLNDAIAWGASTERQLAIWVDLSLNWGEEFIESNGGLYRCWREQSSSGPRLSRQDQLYALDAWSRTLAANTSQRTRNHALPFLGTTLY
ncbi:MAG: DUF4123 domain-containing protein [Halomonas sp.]|nr:DUF4123 domain-containing protein [Halomonas sp.]MCC5904241.1 DUF4123 domain-containing protein [Halomonas sp.]